MGRQTHADICLHALSGLHMGPNMVFSTSSPTLVLEPLLDGSLIRPCVVWPGSRFPVRQCLSQQFLNLPLKGHNVGYERSPGSRRFGKA